MSDYTDAAQYLRLAEQSNDNLFQRRALSKGAKEITRLQAENEELRARVAELEQLIQYAQVESGVCMCGDMMEDHNQASGHSPVDIWDHARDKVIESSTSESWLLRKQAEAVDEIEGFLCVAGSAQDLVRLSKNYAQRLRTQADELERQSVEGG